MTGNDLVPNTPGKNSPDVLMVLTSSIKCIQKEDLGIRFMQHMVMMYSPSFYTLAGVLVTPWT